MFDEVEVDAELQKRRGAQAGYLDSSFPTIAGEKAAFRSSQASNAVPAWCPEGRLPGPDGVPTS